VRNYTLKPFVPSKQDGPGAQKYSPEAHRAPDAAAVADARASERRPAPPSALLSMGHIASPPAPPRRVLKIWTEGARADFPGSPLRGIQPRPLPPNPSKRGEVTVFSQKSRRRLLRALCCLKVDAVCYTMALTLPGATDHLDHQTVIDLFRTLIRRLRAVKRFQHVSGYWKRELQKRGAIHYHLLLYGLDDPVFRAEFQAWMVAQWNRLVCVGLCEEETEKHRWWHAREENMEPVRSMGYFAKYVQKGDDDAPLKGRWWADFNKTALPVSPMTEIEVTDRMAVWLNRIARKVRQKRADAGKHAALGKALGEGSFFARLTLWDLQRLRGGYDLNGFRNLEAARLVLACYEIVCKRAGLRAGRFRFQNLMSHGPIVLCSRTISTLASQAFEWTTLATH